MKLVLLFDSIIEDIIRYDIKLCEFFISSGFPLNKRQWCHYAVSNGNLEVLKWTRNNNCPWDIYSCNNAALYGHLEILK